MSGRSFKALTDLGTEVSVWVADRPPGSAPTITTPTAESEAPLYFCHGHALGTFREFGYTPASGASVQQVLQDEWRPVSEREARAGDVLTWTHVTKSIAREWIEHRFRDLYSATKTRSRVNNLTVDLYILPEIVRKIDEALTPVMKHRDLFGTHTKTSVTEKTVATLVESVYKRVNTGFRGPAGYIDHSARLETVVLRDGMALDWGRSTVSSKNGGEPLKTGVTAESIIVHYANPNYINSLNVYTRKPPAKEGMLKWREISEVWEKTRASESSPSSSMGLGGLPSDVPPKAP